MSFEHGPASDQTTDPLAFLTDCSTSLARLVLATAPLLSFPLQLHPSSPPTRRVPSPAEHTPSLRRPTSPASPSLRPRVSTAVLTSISERPLPRRPTLLPLKPSSGRAAPSRARRSGSTPQCSNREAQVRGQAARRRCRGRTRIAQRARLSVEDRSASSSMLQRLRTLATATTRRRQR